MKKIHVYRAGRVRTLKDGVSITDEEWERKGSHKAIDGCRGIEPDGHCEHGHPSWLLALGYI